jgi:hypothetical protein
MQNEYFELIFKFIFVAEVQYNRFLRLGRP